MVIRLLNGVNVAFLLICCSFEWLSFKFRHDLWPSGALSIGFGFGLTARSFADMGESLLWTILRNF